jgi:hypothetical protein
MTGSPNTGAGGASGTDESDCSSYYEQTPLNSPDSEVLQDLKQDDILTLRLDGDRGPLLALDSQGRVAGSLTMATLTNLINCIQEKYVYVAKVLKVNKGKCDVEIRLQGRS